MLVQTIDFNFVLSTIKDIIEKKCEENMQEIEQYTSQGGKQSQLTYDMVDFNYNKMVSLNFLKYCFEKTGTLQFDLNLFEELEDKEEILQYVCNNLYTAFSSHNPPRDKAYMKTARCTMHF